MIEVMKSATADEISAVMRGKQRAFLMRRMPGFLSVPFKIYLYENKGDLRHIVNIADSEYRFEGRGAIVGECICWRIEKSDDPRMAQVFQNALCMTMREITENLDGKQGYVCFLEKAEIYKEPKRLEDFGKSRPPNPWCRVGSDENEQTKGRRMKKMNNNEKILNEYAYAIKRAGLSRYIKMGALKMLLTLKEGGTFLKKPRVSADKPMSKKQAHELITAVLVERCIEDEAFLEAVMDGCELVPKWGTETVKGKQYHSLKLEEERGK